MPSGVAAILPGGVRRRHTPTGLKGARDLPMDVLSDIFTTIRLRGTFYFRSEFSPPYAIRVPAYRSAARFHYVLRGSAHVTLLRSGRTVSLTEGDFALIPAGAPHVFADTPGRDGAPLETVLRTPGYTGDGLLVLGGPGDASALTRTVCGHFDFRDGADHPLLRALPEIIVVGTQDRAQMPFLEETLRLLVEQVFSDRPGSIAAVLRLSEVLFIEAMRSGLAQAPALAGLIEAFADPAIGRALVLIHHDPARPWTVETLAREVGLSRSRLAERFAALVGIGPMGYLAEWRMQRALALLEDGGASVREAARRVGYLSPAAFSRAFAQRFGRSPRDAATYARESPGGSSRRPGMVGRSKRQEPSS